MIINASVSGGVKGFRRYEYTNPTDISGAGSYITVVAQNAELARVRSFASLVVLYHLAGDISCTKSGIACNTANYLPGLNCAATHRLNASGGETNAVVANTISDGADLSTGSGRVYITPEGDLRIYGNTNAYHIKAGKVLVEVIWEEEA